MNNHLMCQFNSGTPAEAGGFEVVDLITKHIDFSFLYSRHPLDKLEQKASFLCASQDIMHSILHKYIFQLS